MDDRIQQNEVNAALAAIETNLETIHAKIANVSNVADELSSAWSSDNATMVKGYVTKMEEDLSKLYTSIGRIKGNVQMVVSAIEAADAVKINTGGGTSGVSHQTSSQFSQTSMR